MLVSKYKLVQIVLVGELFFGFAISGKAQNEFDVLRYSNIEHYGDARFNAMGGSFGALGANMSSLSINPGGLGVFKSSDFSFTPSFHYNYSESVADNTLGTDGKLNFHFSNIGIVGTFEASNGWRSFNMSVGYNRLANYNRSVTINSTTDSSFLSTYTNELNSFDFSQGGDIAEMFPFTANLGYQTYLVNPMAADSTKFDHVFKDSKNIKQQTNIETKGGSGETYFAMGGNYGDKLFIGGLIGIPSVRYEYNRFYRETSEEGDTLTDFTAFSVNENIKTSGAGVNFKLGMIYSFSDWFRFGVAFHTPTVYGLSDSWETTVVSENKNGEKLTEKSPYGTFNYIVTTPYRFITSGAFVFSRYGVLNVDYEYVDYSTARIKQDNSFGVGADFSLENQAIRSNFESTHNIRLGTEWRLDPFRFRAGYRFQGNPLDSRFNADYGSNLYSAGIGIKQDEYYFDVAYAMRKYNSVTSIIAQHGDYARVDLTDHYLSFTLGFRF
ncbi:MAG TPA: outer membrane protein transport protein [Vicingaceae bacterium]